MSIILIIASTIAVLIIWQHKTTKQICFKVLEMVIVYMNPTFLICLTFGIKFSSNTIHKHNIFTLEPEKLNLVGQVKYLCFDKTGTLTQQTNELTGFLDSKKFRSKKPSH